MAIHLAPGALAARARTQHTWRDAIAYLLSCLNERVPK